MHNFYLFLLIILFLIILAFIIEYSIKLYQPVNNNINNNLSADISVETFKSKKSVRIVCPTDTRGLLVDALIYKKIIQDAEIVFLGVADFDKSEKDITIYLEHASYISQIKYPSKRIWFMVNQELLTKHQNLSLVDIFICKSRYSQILIDDLIIKNNYKGKTIYTRHTSEDFMLNQSINYQIKKYNQFLHLAGKSPFKNTKSVLSAWIENDGFSKFNFPKLILTCRDACAYRCHQYIRDFVTIKPHKSVHKDYKNIILYSNISKEKINKLMLKSGFFITPSAAEGYGHYINEGRSVGAVIITTDLPPMNELVTDQVTGFLIKPDEVLSSRYLTHTKNINGSKCAVVNPITIANVIRNIFTKNKSSLIKMGKKSRLQFEKDNIFLYQTIKKLL